MSIEVIVVEGERKRGAFSNPVVSWRFGIKYGPRAENVLVSRKLYKSTDAAYRAGFRQAGVLHSAMNN